MMLSFDVGQRQYDRRQQATTVPVDRRHGQRRTYRCGCRCTLCRAANAARSARQYRAAKIDAPMLGARVPAARTHILMRVLRCEGFTHGDVAKLLGWHGNYARIYHARTVTLRTQRQIERLIQERVAG